MASSEGKTVRPNWLDLPNHITANILQKVGVIEIVTSASQVCSVWWNICKDPLMWRTIDMTHYPHNYPHYELVKICYLAINRSCGQLEEICMGKFVTTHLLNHIADSTSHLRRLKFPLCWDIPTVLTEVAEKLPQLEELDMSFSSLDKDTLTAFGRCCPHLKALKLRNWMPNETSSYDDWVAFVTAETMPKLCHLQIEENVW